MHVDPYMVWHLTGHAVGLRARSRVGTAGVFLLIIKKSLYKATNQKHNARFPKCDV